MKSTANFSAFLQSIQQHEAGELAEYIRNSQETTQLVNKYSRYFGRLMPAFYILDYTQKKYVYVNSKISTFIDHPISRIMDGGLDFAWSIFNQVDLKIYSEHIITSNLKFLAGIPVQNHQNYVFSCNYRLKNKKGEFKQVLQQSVFIKSTHTGVPLATIGFISDISTFKSDTRIFHTVEPLYNDSVKEDRYLINNFYFPNEEDSLLSKREVEVLKWICEGLKSIEIAHKLKISIFTVNNHRIHILQKTGSQNLVQLIRYAIKNNYL